MIVDTSVWIDFFNNHGSAYARRLAQAIEDGEQIAVPGLVLTETLLGLRSDAAALKIAQLMEAFDWVPEPARTDYLQAAALYRHCRSRGTTIRSTIDCLIARLCIRDDQPLLAKDRDFEQIKKHSGLRLVSVS